MLLGYLLHRCPTAQPVGAWADSELAAERAVEVRQIAEAAIEGDVEDPGRLRCQPHGRLAQPRPQNVLVRRHTGQALEGAEEVERAQPHLSRQTSQAVCGVGMALD